MADADLLGVTLLMLEPKIDRLLLQGLRRDQLECVLGEDTHAIWTAVTRRLSMRQLPFDQIAGIKIVVDTATPRLATVRKRQTHINGGNP